MTDIIHIGLFYVQSLISYLLHPFQRTCQSLHSILLENAASMSIVSQIHPFLIPKNKHNDYSGFSITCHRGVPLFAINTWDLHVTLGHNPGLVSGRTVNLNLPFENPLTANDIPTC